MAENENYQRNGVQKTVQKKVFKEGKRKGEKEKSPLHPSYKNIERSIRKTGERIYICVPHFFE